MGSIISCLCLAAVNANVFHGMCDAGGLYRDGVRCSHVWAETRLGLHDVELLHAGEDSGHVGVEEKGVYGCVILKDFAMDHSTITNKEFYSCATVALIMT